MRLKHRAPGHELAREGSLSSASQAIVFCPEWGFNCIRASASVEKRKEEIDRFLLTLEMLHQPPTPNTDASPSTDLATLLCQQTLV